jgi:hypothetical protein
VLGQLVVAGGNRPILIQATDQPLDLIARAVGDAGEAPLLRLVRPPWDDRADAPSGHLAADRRAAVAPGASQALGPPPRAAAPPPLDRPRIEQAGQGALLVALPRRQHRRHRLAAALRADVDLAAEAAPTAAKGLVTAPFPPPPRAGGRARRSRPRSGSPSPRSPARLRRSGGRRGSSPRPPGRVQRRKRLDTVFQFPYRSGRSRQGAPECRYHRIPLRIGRWSRFDLPTSGLIGARRARRRSYWRSFSACRRTPS